MTRYLSARFSSLTFLKSFVSCSLGVAAKQPQAKSDTTAHVPSTIHLLDEGQRAIIVTKDRSPGRLQDAFECLELARSLEHGRFQVTVERLENAPEQIRFPKSREPRRAQDPFHLQFRQQSQQQVDAGASSTDDEGVDAPLADPRHPDETRKDER